MATSMDTPIKLESEIGEAAPLSEASESDLNESYLKIESNETLSNNTKHDIVSSTQDCIVEDKVTPTWNSSEAKIASPLTSDSNYTSANEDSYVNCAKPIIDCKQNIIDQSMLFNPDTWTVGGDSQIWLEGCQYNNKFQPYERKVGSYKVNNNAKNSYNHPGAPANRQYNQAGNSCHQIPRVNNANAMNYGGNGQHVVHLHVNPGEIISFYMGDHMQLIPGPATVRMVSNNSTPPVPMPVQVPPGHMVQQIVDEQGTLRHIILSIQPPVAVSLANPYSAGTSAGNVTSAPSGSAPFYLYPPQTFTTPSQYQIHMQSGIAGQGLHSPNDHLPPMSNQPPNPGFPDPPASQLGAFKDERTQRQYIKLKKRLEARQKDGTFFPSCSNGPAVKPYNERNETETIEEENPLLKVLSCIKAPTVSNITSKSALIKWLPLELKADSDQNLSESQKSDVVYKLMMCDNKDKQHVVYKGCDLEYLLTNLKPATLYRICALAAIKELVGNPSEKTEFTTLSCEPDPPLPPKLQLRTKTALSLKWNAAVDNGSKILSYNLEYDEGTGTNEFKELFSGLQKSYKAIKLKASTCYRFRLCAINEHGKSLYSTVSCFSTSGSTPSQPLPPVLEKANVHTLLLAWELRPNDDSFTLQLDDENTRHGFLAVYNGQETSYTCAGLNRNSKYRFRLCAINEEGTSPFSQIVEFFTLPDQPGCPGKPYIKGQVHSTSVRVTWDVPKDDGGSPITSYILEMEKENGFESIYSGDELEYSCNRLEPGTTYNFRVQCISSGGRSAFSPIGSITTLPVVPGKCAPPKLLGKAKPISLHLKWAHPDYNGGCEVESFEVEVINPGKSVRNAYNGHATDCVVAGLIPGRQYQFRVRAYNKVGHGPWSDEFETSSGAGPPDIPTNLQANPRSPHSIFVSWLEPPNNGASITSYHLECRHAENEFEQVYSGPLCSAEVKSLSPCMTYEFQVQAVNSAGAGSFSECISCQTPPSSPSSVSTSNVKTTVSATTISLTWTAPNDHGSPITNYNVDTGDSILSTVDDKPTIHIEGLNPETTYKIRIQAVNGVGSGPYSSSLKITTRSPPPPPPVLECGGTTHNTIRLKWGDGKNLDLKTYTLEMEHPTSKKWSVVYQGTCQTFKVSRLQEVTSYNFRIFASSKEGDGSYSVIYAFKTLWALPASPKAPKVLSVTETSAAVEWMPTKPMGDTLSYKLQLAAKDSDFRVVYVGANTTFTIENLIPGTEYSVRAVAIRHCPSVVLSSPTSASTTFTTTKVVVKPPSPKMMSLVTKLTNHQPLTDQQWAVIILCMFTFFAICVAILVERILSYTTS